MELKLPELGDEIAEAQIVGWFVKEGADFSKDDDLLEIVTDKASFNVPAEVTGKVEKILAQEGETVAVGQVLALIQDWEQKI